MRLYRGAGQDWGGAPLLNAKIGSGTLSTAGLTGADDGLLRRVGNRLYQYNGVSGAFELAATNSDALGGQTLAQVRDITATTGNLGVSRVTGAAATATTRLNDFTTAPSADIPLNSKGFTGVRAATVAGEFVEYGQFSAAIANASSGVYYKSPVRAVATTNITLSGTQIVDTVSLVVGDRALAAGQANAANNGIYVVAAGVWTRATDADQSGELMPGTTLHVAEGAGEGDKQWGLISDAAVTPGTTAQTWARTGSAGSAYTAGNDAIIVSGTTISARVQAGGGLQIVTGQGLALATGFFVKTLAGTMPSGSTSPVVTHNFGTKNLLPAQVYVVATDEPVDTDWIPTDLNTVTFTFGAAPTANQYRYVLAAAL